jgi:hypothetical protein
LFSPWPGDRPSARQRKNSQADGKVRFSKPYHGSADVEPKPQNRFVADLLGPEVFDCKKWQDHQGEADHGNAEESFQCMAQTIIYFAPAEHGEPNLIGLPQAAASQPQRRNQNERGGASDSVFQRALSNMMTEIFDGPPGREAYLLNQGNG